MQTIGNCIFANLDALEVGFLYETIKPNHRLEAISITGRIKPVLINNESICSIACVVCSLHKDAWIYFVK